METMETVATETGEALVSHWSVSVY